jgi:hypothetical protein
MKQYFFRVGIALSMLLNVMLGGSIGQTFSARQHEAKRNGKRNLSLLVDVFCGEGHCMRCWAFWKVRKW